MFSRLNLSSLLRLPLAECCCVLFFFTVTHPEQHFHFSKLYTHTFAVLDEAGGQWSWRGAVGGSLGEGCRRCA